MKIFSPRVIQSTKFTYTIFLALFEEDSACAVCFTETSARVHQPFFPGAVLKAREERMRVRAVDCLDIPGGKRIIQVVTM